VLRGNYNQLVLPVTKGRSDVVLRYRPPGFTIAGAVSGTTLIAVVLVTAANGLRRRRRRRRVHSFP
jgi:uncharacterized protein (TIGR03382 family)